MIEPGGYVRDLLNGTPGAEAVAHGWVKTRRTVIASLSLGSAVTVFCGMDSIILLLSLGTLVRRVSLGLSTGQTESRAGRMEPSAQGSEPRKLRRNDAIEDTAGVASCRPV